jgi:hypothetical protein
MSTKRGRSALQQMSEMAENIELATTLEALVGLGCWRIMLGVHPLNVHQEGQIGTAADVRDGRKYRVSNHVGGSC